MNGKELIMTNGQRSLAFVNTNPNILAERLGNLITNGKKLLPEERLALAQYSVATGLNPFVGECYYLPGIGPGPGIAGWRVKAEEQLEYEAMKARTPAARFWCEYVEPGEGEGHYDPDKDIAVKAILHDTISRTAWEQRVLAHYVELMKNKIENGWNIARELVGPEPVWTAIGVVRSGENFGTSERMDRYERACKRAEKAAIRKRFPRIHLPEPLGFNAEDVIEAELHDIPEPQTISQNMSELGFTPEPIQETLPILTLNQAREMTTSKGVKYGAMLPDGLSAMSGEIVKKLNAGTLTREKMDEYQLKLEAIKMLLAEVKP